MTSVVWVRWRNGGKKRRKANSPTFENNQTSLPMQLKKQPFEKFGFSFENFGKEKTYTRPYNLIH